MTANLVMHDGVPGNNLRERGVDAERERRRETERERTKRQREREEKIRDPHSQCTEIKRIQQSIF